IGHDWFGQRWKRPPSSLALAGGSPLFQMRLSESVIPPKALRDQLGKVLVGIAELQTGRTTRPVHLAFDRNLLIREPSSPSRQVSGGHGKREVSLAVSAVTGNGPARCRKRLGRCSLFEQQED